MDSKLTRWCKGFIEAGWLAAVIVAPLFFNIHSERVFEPDKLTLVRSIALVMSAAWVVQFVDSQGWRNLTWLNPRNKDSIWRMPFVLPIFALVIVYLLSTAFSVVPSVSWAGSYQRLQGTYTTMAYIVIFALAIATIRRREQVSRLVTTIIITSIPIALYGMIQHFGLDPLPWGGDTQRRVAGHMGNAIFIAAYLIMVAPITLARILDAFTNILSEEEFSYADVIRSSIYIFTFAIQLLAIYWSGSRGPMLGLIVGIFAFVLILLVSLRNAVGDSGQFGIRDTLQATALSIGGALAAFLLLSLIIGQFVEGSMASFLAFVGALGVVALAIFILLVSRRGWRWLWLSWILLTGIAGLWLALFNVPNERADEFANTPVAGAVLESMTEWKELPTVGRFGSVLESEGGTGRVRVLIWQGVLELLQPHDPLVFPDGTADRWNFLRPLLGYGPESMYVAYNSFYQPELASIEARNASPDRSHNETFDALIITGVLGFLTWQILYLSVFYYGFRWLGVVRSSRDRNLLILFWIAGAVLGALIISQLLGAVYLGVAIPFGSIVGLVIYLMYYALFTRKQTEQEQDPFYVDRLIMMGLLAAVVAHYVEIHFGIAIASTRVHFFVYVALMFLVGYLLPQRQEQSVPAVNERVTPARRRRRTSAGKSSRPAWLGSVLAATYVLTLILAITGFQYMNFVLTGELQTIDDVPSVAEIMHQAFLINPSQNFGDSPFIFLMIVLTWGLGTLLSISEMAGQGILKFVSQARQNFAPSRQRILVVLLIVQAVFALAGIFLSRGDAATPTGVNGLLGAILLVSWGALSGLGAILVAGKRASAQRFTAVISLVGLLLSLPAMTAGVFWLGIGVFLLSAVALYFSWDDAWANDLRPAAIIAAVSWIVAFAYIALHASLLRSSFIGPQVATASEVERQILASDGFASLLTFFYLFVFSLIILAAFGLAESDPTPARKSVSVPAIATLVILVVAGIFLVNRTNLRIIQADMVYKRARPLERIARREATQEGWDFPVAIYEHAIELAPLEDFYYLFLGAAYLEQSSVTQQEESRLELLTTARDRLEIAQKINPLNTDHTANLARLMTRWAATSSADPAQQERLTKEALEFYERALELSPRNSTIWNEYANLLLTLEGDCPAGIEAYEHSLELDPSYNVTYLGLAGALQTCAEQVSEDDRAAYLQRAAELVLSALEVNDENRGAYMLQAGQLLRQAKAYEQALQVFEELQALDDPTAPSWRILLEMARVYRNMSELELASEMAQQALLAAPPEDQAGILQFVDQLNAQIERNQE